jgi:large subunit ribosomal protein L21
MAGPNDFTFAHKYNEFILSTSYICPGKYSPGHPAMDYFDLIRPFYLKLYQTLLFLQSQNKTDILYSMYAIVSIAGQQFKVEKGEKVFVHRLPGEIGDTVSFDKVMLISHDEKTNVGSPYLIDAVVLAKIISHDRGDKVLVFKKKRRKGYQKLNGHRQNFTRILIEDISETGAPRKVEKKKSEAAKTEPVVEAITEAVKQDEPETIKAASRKPAAKARDKAKDKVEEKPKKTTTTKATGKAAKPAAKKAPAKSKGDASK